MKLNWKTENALQSLKVVTIISFSLLFVSCKETIDSSKNTESELIMKINAVQEQVMAQGNISEEEEQAISSLCSIVSNNDGLANYSEDNRMILKDVDKAPVFKGCEELSPEENRICFNNKLSTFIKQEFNLSISENLNLSESKQVDVFFIIDKDGNTTGMKVRDSEVTIQAEILRVLKKVAVVKPAIHNGKSVSVLCSILLKYGNDIEIDVVYIPERPND